MRVVTWKDLYSRLRSLMSKKTFPYVLPLLVPVPQELHFYAWLNSILSGLQSAFFDVADKREMTFSLLEQHCRICTLLYSINNFGLISYQNDDVFMRPVKSEISNMATL